MTIDEIREKIYNIVLSARTEGIVGGKTKWFARDDADQILSIELPERECPACKGTGSTDLIFPVYCPMCNHSGKLPPVTVEQAIREAI